VAEVLFRGHGALALYSFFTKERLESTVTVTINKQKQCETTTPVVVNGYNNPPKSSNESRFQDVSWGGRKRNKTSNPANRPFLSDRATIKAIK